ncbi:unnamed protein product [Periconia digitata]|uniref:Uncharacterized protein n=1 Tax=Periconia digitata TaxID=1303443 RepID=A0A9W4XKA6_9PLEO|nr:unnamed protein product [Periconia digitata]
MTPNKHHHHHQQSSPSSIIAKNKASPTTKIKFRTPSASWSTPYRDRNHAGAAMARNKRTQKISQCIAVPSSF